MITWCLGVYAVVPKRIITLGAALSETTDALGLGKNIVAVDVTTTYPVFLNKVLKESSGQTTTSIITLRVIQEAKILLKQTDWSISDISYSLGFDDLAHFSNFFKKQTSITPIAFRS